MPDQFLDTAINRLIYLETKMGTQVQHQIMPPFNKSFHDTISIQETAKEIAAFIGMDTFTFIVSFTKQKEKVGGHIDLSNSGKNVFIEIDENSLDFPEAICATLCHEICHKWLQKNHLELPVERENEILTDIATIFLGLGKVMLNGSKTSAVKEKMTSEGTRTTTRTLTVGYLDINQLAVVYELICRMRKIPSIIFMKGLSEDAIYAVDSITTQLSEYSNQFYSPDIAQQTIDRFTNLLSKTQFVLAELDKQITYIERGFLETTRDFLKLSHKKIKSYYQGISEFNDNQSEDSAIDYLKALKIDREIIRLNPFATSLMNESKKFFLFSQSISNKIGSYNQVFPKPKPDMFTIVTCPNDGTKLRLPENSPNILVTCSKCNYRFAYNTSTLSILNKQNPIKKILHKAKIIFKK